MRRVLLALAVAVVAAGCASKIEGETDALPPAGGPKASTAHPPGETAAVIDQEKR